MLKEKLKKVAENVFELPKEGKMLVPGRIFASENLFKNIEEVSIKQVSNVAQLPGIVGYSIAMPDIHPGYGFPIGGVAAFDVKKGIISPGGIGYDINCSVRLLRTNLSLEKLKKNEKIIADKLFEAVPSGVGRGGLMRLSDEDLTGVLKEGAQWLVKKGFGVEDDYVYTEEQGKLAGAKPENVSDRAKNRGKPQLGTLGAGNHFLEVQEVIEIFDEKVARVFGLEKGQVTIMIHCGSRGLGHQTASDYLLMMEKEYGFEHLPDRELIAAPINSELGQKYLSAMAAAANFAFANKQLITHRIRESMKKIFPDFKAEVVYDICHNIAKFERYNINGEEKEFLIVRKGATRSFGIGKKEIPEKYRGVGCPILIPGSMGTYSYVLVGTKKAEEISFSSTAHGAGRLLSRAGAKKSLTTEEVKAELKEKGVYIKAGSIKGILEEAPEAYKDVEEVVRVSHDTGIGNLVAKMKPLIVIKG